MKKILIIMFLSDSAFGWGSAGFNYVKGYGGYERKYWLNAEEPLYKKVSIGAYSQYESKEWSSNYNEIYVSRQLGIFKLKGLYIQDGIQSHGTMRYETKIGAGFSIDLWK